jgi:hypothetical protein
MAAGLKTIETRDWPTRYRGPLVIHAAKRPMTGEEKSLLYIWICRGLIPTDWLDRSLPYGAIIAVVQLVRCEPAGTFRVDRLNKEFGNFAASRWAWITRYCRPLDRPVPWRGAQGLFEVPDSAWMAL